MPLWERKGSGEGAEGRKSPPTTRGGAALTHITILILAVELPPPFAA